MRESSKLKWTTPEILSDIKKRWLFVIGIYSFAFLLGELTIIGYAANSFLLELGILSSAVFLLLWIFGDSLASPETSKFAEAIQKKMQTTAVQKNSRVWMVLHRILQYIEISAVLLAFLAVMISSQIETVPEVRSYYFIWWLLCSCIAFPYFHRVRNILRMQCTEIEGGSLTGARAFSSLASKLLAEKNDRGTKLLAVSLRMLKRGFKSKGILVDNMDETLEIVFIVGKVDCIPYELLTSLSEGIAEASSLSGVPELFQDFLNSEELVFAKGFKKVERQRGTALWLPRISLIAVFVTAVGTLIQAVMPESLKENIVSFLLQIFGSPSLLLIILLFALAAVLAHYLNRFSETSVSWKDLKRIDTT